MKRERITITVDTNLLDSVDSLIDNQTLRNRSQTIEHLLKEGLALHELHHAFIFLESAWSPAVLSHTVLLLCEAGVRHLFLATPSTTPGVAAEAALALQQFREQHPRHAFDYTPVPSDFGSGGAVVLQQAALTQPFFMAWVGDTAASIQSLIPVYTFHRQHHQPLTLVNYGATIPFALANPELIAQIPPGLSSLRSTVFPQVVKTGTVRGYLVG